MLGIESDRDQILLSVHCEPTSTEAELIALAKGFFKVSLPILGLFDFILTSAGKPKMHIRVFEDNQSTIKVLSNGWSPNLCSTGRVHKGDIVSLHHQFFVEEPRYAHIRYCKSEDQRADIFTKALEPHKWAHARNLLGITHDLGNVAEDDLATIEIGE